MTVGGFPFCCLSALPLAYFPAPIPLTPFPTGRGRFFCFLMQGAKPLASPRLNRKRHRLTLRSRYPAEACPAGRRLTPPLWCPQGACLPCRPPTLPLVYFSAPYPPAPLPRWGRGRFFCFLMQGASPLASPGAEPGRHWFDFKKPILLASPENAGCSQ